MTAPHFDLTVIAAQAERAYGEQDVGGVDLRPLILAILAVAERLDRTIEELDQILSR